MYHPKKCAPYFLNSPSATPLPFWGFSNRPDRKSQRPVAAIWHIREINSQKFSHLERISHGVDNPPLQYSTGLTTHLFNPSPKITRYRYKYEYKYMYIYMYNYGYIYRYMKVRRTVE
jgi:hypothetical protein